MEQRGFIHSMMDVKVLILYAMSRVEGTATAQKIYELCFQDDCVSYFDIQEALPQLEASGHLALLGDNTYEITAEGRETGALVEDSLAYPVAQRVEAAVAQYNREQRRQNRIRAEIRPRDNGEYTVAMGLHDHMGSLMSLELMAPSEQQAQRMADAFRNHAEEIFQQIMAVMLERTEGRRSSKGAAAGNPVENPEV
ncbi:DUF4364 family protein [Candidatus Avoscillospira sp. LCP25S3_F1]|uniref:DUF4364 family protein n=1 Tax=Candidatus Avoscillospira sp. LCP25S3_F1 TaxID=3438825 RepID=UPI003F8FAAE4